MLKQGVQRLQLGLSTVLWDESALLAERLLSSKLAGPSAESGALFVRRFHAYSGTSLLASGNLLQRTALLTGRLQPQENVLLRAFRRAFSSPRKGFENFTPKGHTGGAASKASKKAEGGSGGGNGSNGGDPESNSQQPGVNPLNLVALLLVAGYLWSQATGLLRGPAGQRQAEISFQEFRNRLLAQGKVARLEVANNALVKVYVKPDSLAAGPGPAEGEVETMAPSTAASPSPSGNGVFRYYFHIGSVDSFERKLDEAQAELGVRPEDRLSVKFVDEVSLLSVVLDIAPTLLLIGATYWIINRQMRQMTGMGGLGRGMPGLGRNNRGGQGGAGGFFGMSRANVSSLDKSKGEKIMFKDVAGCDEAKVEIMEFVDFLKNPKKYSDLGAKIPKGALLVGPPGTGKTLLAKATAGEANVPFLSISGSDFMEMFVGVGPARVRDLFAQARQQHPSIIFIDEIDAIGRARGRGGAMGGHDERENTLNQLLVEMDGFATTSGVVVLAGTNRPDILDKALLRPGRFDRMITVDTPDIKGREQIFRVHLGKLKLTRPADYYAERLAALTPGMSGADIANVCNEAALVAARLNMPSVDMEHFESAIDRVIGGLEKKNKVISPEERRTVAYHESGHAVVSWFLEYAEPLLKVSIVPRGTSVLGFAQYLPNENLLLTKEQLLDRVCATLGGRAAEQVMLGKISTGAVNDLERVTSMAYSQVAVYGMNEKVGLVSFRMERDAFDKPYSDETARMIDQEVRAFVDAAYKRTVEMVEKYKDRIEAMTQELLHKEVLNLDDVERLLGKRPFESKELRNIDRFRHGSGAAAAAAAGASSSPEAPAASNDGTSGGSGEQQGPPPPGEGGKKAKPQPAKMSDPGVIVAT